MGVFHFFHSSAYCRQASKSALGILRKKTGYSLANCRKALELHNNDAVKAEEWLKEQAKAMGWAVANKVQNRQVPQGLVGVFADYKKVAMVEVNCETDFVSRNDKFKSFVELVAETCMQVPVLGSGPDTNQVMLSSEELGKLKAGGTSLADHMALIIGSVGENMKLRRAFCYETTREDINVVASVHPPVDNSRILLGKYGAFVSFQRNPEASSPDDINVQDIGHDLCKHIIGMNPIKIGEVGKDECSENEDEERILIYQDFLLNDSVTVGDYLTDCGIRLLDFKRLECGEPELNREESPTMRESEANSA